MQARIEPIRQSVTVRIDRERAFHLFTEQMGTWWPVGAYSRAVSEFVGEHVQVTRLDFQARLGGSILEHLSDGRIVPWAEVIDWHPPHRVVMAWRPHARPEPPTEVEVTFTARGGGTLVELEHRGWERLSEDFREELHETYARGWITTLGSFAAAARSPDPDPTRAEEGRMPFDRSYVEQNARERERLRALVARLSDDELSGPVNEHWTVAGVLGHIAFWDARALFLAGKLERGLPFSPSDDEPEDVDWINDATRPLIHAIAPRDVAQLALRLAEETDEGVASLAPDRMYPNDAASPLNPFRAAHRAEHLDEIEASLAGR